MVTIHRRSHPSSIAPDTARFGGDGLTCVWYNDEWEMPFRLHEKWYDDSELLAQGRFLEHAQSKRQFNSAPYYPDRASAKAAFLKEVDGLPV